MLPPMIRNPTWTRDELILALDLYMRHRERLAPVARERGRLACEACRFDFMKHLV